MTIERPETLLRHLLTTTSVNIVTAAQESETDPSGGRFRLPITAFLDRGGLLDALEVEVSNGAPSARWDFYRRSVEEHGYELRDESGQLAHRGDVHFAFPAPERAFEDDVIVSELTRRGILSRRAAACLLMVDFPNPVFSRRRESLLRHVPATSQRADGQWDLEVRLVDSILDASVTDDSPEAEFRRYWETGDEWPSVSA